MCVCVCVCGGGGWEGGGVRFDFVCTEALSA